MNNKCKETFSDTTCPMVRNGLLRDFFPYSTKRGIGNTKIAGNIF